MVVCIFARHLCLMTSLKHNLVKMGSLLKPRQCVEGMKVLDKSFFDMTLTVSYITVQSSKLHLVKKAVNKYLLRMPKFKPIQDSQEADEKYVLFHPNYHSLEDIEERDRHKLAEIGITHEHFHIKDIHVGYDQWRCGDIFRAILRSLETDNVTGFSTVGHIIQVSLREHLLPYKKVIGQVLLDKNVNAKTIVNKTDIIGNTYRTFEMEVLAGEDNLITTVKENYCTYEFDFGRVYWNPRLSTEHQCIVDKLHRGDTLYDVFAGVGPFVVPSAKKGVRVLANDLNPESYKWLLHNVKLNKVERNVECFNQDGREFILQHIKQDLLKQLTNESDDQSLSTHITMNLPAIATEFLPAFRGLLPEEYDGMLPIIHLYCFTQCEYPEECAVQLIEESMGCKIDISEVVLVRQAAPAKIMMRVSFTPPREYLTVAKDEPASKKICLTQLPD